MSVLQQLWHRISPRRSPGVQRRSPADRNSTRLMCDSQSLCIELFRDGASVIPDRIEHLRQSFQQSPAEGHVLEFGVFKGTSLNLLAKWSQSREDPRVFGFDSFVGLPEDWVRTKQGDRYQRGHFALSALPAVAANAQLVPGFFDRSLPRWLAENAGPVAFLHNDSDLYSSTKTTLSLLNERIVPGTIIAFDELCDWSERGVYSNWEQGEWLALREWLAETDRRIEVLSRNGLYGATIRVAR